jgi:hypothetical protein
MPEIMNVIPVHLKEPGTLPPVAKADSESIPRELGDYVTPPPKTVIAVAVQYREAKKGRPMSYELPGRDGQDLT